VLIAEFTPRKNGTAARQENNPQSATFHTAKPLAANTKESTMEERLNGLESIIHSLDCNIKLLECISYDLHNERFSLNNNIGLYWVWKSILESQIIDFYKLNVATEKFSFQKTLNLVKDSKAKIDYEKLDKMIKTLKADFDKNQFDIIRSKYLAHQDIGAPEVKTDLIIVRKFTDQTISLFQFLFSEIKREYQKFSDDILNSFKVIFERIDEYEKVSAFIMEADIKGEKTINISKLEEAIKK